MVIDERMAVFLDTYYPGNTEFLDLLEKHAIETDVPVIRKGTQSVLRFLLEMKKPETILEIGTAIGFSACFFCTWSEAKVTTIEQYEKRIPLAEENFRAAGLDRRITLLKGDAAGILPGLTGSYDMIFMDASKGQYITFLPEIRRLLKRGGILAADNVLQDGELLESRFAVERRDRTIHTRMREYLKAISEDPEFVTTILPVGDGLAVTVKREKTEHESAECGESFG